MPSERAAAVLLALLLAGPGEGAVVERILAVVDGRPVLLSEVAVVEKLRRDELAPALEALIDEQLMYREAARLPQAAVSEEEEERAYRSLLEKVMAETPDEREQLRRLARRQTAILKYVEFRFRPQVRVSEEEVREAWASGGGAAGRSLEEATPALRARLEEEDLSRRIEAWVQDLRRQADIRYNAAPPLAGAGAS